MKQTNRQVEVLPNPDALFRRAAEEFLRQAISAVQAKGTFTVALSGGSTPRGLFQLLAVDDAFRTALPWAQSHFFWVDERHVSPVHPDNNYRLAWSTMLSKVPVPLENIHPIRSELPDAGQAAEKYEAALREFFHLAPGQFPRFDLVLLGMGADGHTASLFPGAEAWQETQRLVVANWVEKLQAWRITLTLPVLNNAACVMFLVSGPDKAPALREVLADESPRYPAQLVNPTNGRLLWLVDQSAEN